MFPLAPGSYSPEKCKLDFQPAFTFGGRHNLEKPSQTPGIYFFSNQILIFPKSKLFVCVYLAPGSYAPEKCLLDHQAAFSFGIKPEQKIKNEVPAPNQYAPEKFKLEYQPAFSFGARHNLEKPNNTPGNIQQHTSTSRKKLFSFLFCIAIEPFNV